jgi:hypothetical protein
MTLTLTALVKDHADRARRIREHARKHGEMYRKVLAVLNKLKIDSLSANLDSYDLNISFAGGISEIGAVWGALRKLGLKPEKHPGAAETYFTTRFRTEAGDSGPSIYLAFSSTVCRQIQVGTKMVEVPVYETRCTET